MNISLLLLTFLRGGYSIVSTSIHTSPTVCVTTDCLLILCTNDGSVLSDHLLKSAQVVLMANLDKKINIPATNEERCVCYVVVCVPL